MMKGLRNIGLSILLILVIAGNALALCNNSANDVLSNPVEASQIAENAEIENPDRPIYLEIEINNFTHTITEVHRLVSLLVLSNRIIPVNHNFSRVTLIRVPVNFSSPVPIFIKGHALLN